MLRLLQYITCIKGSENMSIFRLRKDCVKQSLVLCKYSSPGESQPFYFPLYHSPTTGSASVQINVGKE